MNDTYKEVRFDTYCSQCKFAELQDHDSPCNECLESGANINSCKPTQFEERD